MVPSDGQKYDVAISLLSRDASIGAELADRLQRAGWEVFFYRERLEETAGPEGVEWFRTPFRENTRFSLILFREGWGETEWTAVEAQAIKERQLEDRWRSFQVVRVGPGELPKWIPDEHIWVDFDEYGVEGAAAVTEEHLRRSGTEASPETPAERAERLQRQQNRRRQQAGPPLEEGSKARRKALDEMLALARAQVEEIAGSGVDIGVVEKDGRDRVWAVNLPRGGLELPRCGGQSTSWI